jgi:hypothetical protein
MAIKPEKYKTPAVPLRTPMFDQNGQLTRTWIIFFERLGTRIIEEEGEPGTGGGVFQRTLLLKDTASGDDIADHVTVYEPGTATQIVGVLRKTITAALTVRVNKNGTPLITLTIPSSTAIDTPVISTAFTATAMAEGDVLTWDVTASDNSRDAAGVASFTLEWQ